MNCVWAVGMKCSLQGNFEHLKSRHVDRAKWHAACSDNYNVDIPVTGLKHDQVCIRACH